MELRRTFDGCSKEIRGFSLFSSNLCRPPLPAHSHFAFRIPHSELRTTQTLPLPKGYTPFAAQIPPPAAPQPAIQSASQPDTNFPDEPFLPHRFMLDKIGRAS